MLMGLPSKRQLHKHKRGTRKALDTLNVLELEDEKTRSENETKSVKKTKKTDAKRQTLKKTNAKKTTTPQTDNRVKRGNGRAEKPESMKTPDKRKNRKSSEPIIGKRKKSVEPIELVNIGSVEPDRVSGEPTVGKTANRVLENSEKKAATMEEQEAKQVDLYDDIDEDTQKDKFLVFHVAGENYGIEIRYVEDIILMQKITVVPNTPSFIKGVINLRGKVIPVIDVRDRFGQKPKEYDDQTCIVVVLVNEVSVGLIVDAVTEVAVIPENQIDPAPKSRSGSGRNYIRGMGKIDKSVYILLDVQRVLDYEKPERN